MIALALAAIRPLSSVHFRNNREWGVQTSSAMHLGRVSAGWHARMSNRLAGKGACALRIASVCNIRLRPSPRLDTGGRRMGMLVLIGRGVAGVKGRSFVLGSMLLTSSNLQAATQKHLAAPPRPVVLTPRTVVTPPAAYLYRVVRFESLPVAIQLIQMLDEIKVGYQITWERSGSDWILRTTAYDALSKQTDSVDYEFIGDENDASAGILLNRVVMNGREFRGYALAGLVKNSFGDLFFRPVITPPGKPADAPQK